MRNRIRTNSFRTIRKAFARFFSLMIMSALGMFVFTGLKATAPDMLKTLDRYLDRMNIYDIRVVSPTGLTQEDLNALGAVKGVALAEGAYGQDVIAYGNGQECVMNVTSLPAEINTFQLIEGALPEAADEIVVESNFLKVNDMQIGDTVTLESDFFQNKTLTITGTIDSALYFNNVLIEPNRGSTSIGSGKINYYAYMTEDNYLLPVYTQAYLIVDGAKDLLTSSEEYTASIEAVMEKVEEIDDGWYVYDRTGYSTYSDYIDDAKSIDNLARIFPIVFFLVAVLVSLISMNRMVEDDRLEIGTLKSLGFSNGQIMHKYAAFSLLATIFGGIVGAALGLIVIPRLIFYIYKMLFDIPDFLAGLELATTIEGFAITVVCVCGTSILTAYKVLKEKPSQLMRPKAPKSGKRVFLEHIGWLWTRLKFSRKVTIRNLFRYKKRVFVTVGGIAGCTALMLCGFGVKDAIADIVTRQYDGIYQFDATAYISGLDDSEQGRAVLDAVFDLDKITSFTSNERLNAEIFDSDKEKSVNGYIFVSESDEDFCKMTQLLEDQTGEPIHLEAGKIVITEKMADLLTLQVGDQLSFTDVDHVDYSYEISAIATNYMEHLIFMDQATFSQTKEFTPNMVYFNTEDLSEEEQDELAASLLEQGCVLNVTFKEALVQSAEDMLQSLNKVVLILIVLAAILSFVVLYNLSNININERKREIATLKVLGFYHHEVDRYITRENILLTLIGIAIGLALGYFLSHAVVTTVEIERARFINEIKIYSYFYSGVMAVIFTLIVNLITHFHLKRIDMIDSLKSVE